MKAAIFDRFGDPSEVLEIRDVAMPEPARGQVRVRMLASPVNPSDLLYVRGEYGKRPELPTSAGFEGVGTVEVTGGGLLRHVRGLRPGRRVAVLNGRGGNWQEHVVVSARELIPVPGNVSDEQAASFFVNPASAYVMTRWILRVRPGAWLVQTAAGSALGRMVIHLGRHYGFRTINIVRRPDQAEELRRSGADGVICTSSEPIEGRVLELTGGAGAPYAIDAVGGETGSAVVRALARDGRMLVYGTLSEQPLTLHPRVLMVGQKRIEGFWLSEWARNQGPLTMLRLFRRIGTLLEEGVLRTEIASAYPLDQIKVAMQHAAQPGRQGKVLLRMQ